MHEDTSINGCSEKAEIAFKQNYPDSSQHLLGFKKELSARNVAETGIRYEWYASQRWASSYWQELETPKIVYPDIYLHQSFAWDTNNYYLGNTTYFIPTTEKWLLGLLNSSVIEWFYEQISNRIQGGYLRAFSDRMQMLPIPTTDSRQRIIIENLIGAIERDANAPEYERLINGLVYELFFPEELYTKGIWLFDACTTAGIADWKILDQTKNRNEEKTTSEMGWHMNATITADEIFHPQHPIYGMLFELQTLEVVGIIELAPEKRIPC